MNAIEPVVIAWAAARRAYLDAMKSARALRCDHEAPAEYGELGMEVAPGVPPCRYGTPREEWCEPCQKRDETDDRARELRKARRNADRRLVTAARRLAGEGRRDG